MDEEWTDSDYATARAGALLELALNIEGVKDKDVRDKILRAMDLLNDGIEMIVRPKTRPQRASLLPLKGGLD